MADEKKRRWFGRRPDIASEPAAGAGAALAGVLTAPLDLRAVDPSAPGGSSQSAAPPGALASGPAPTEEELAAMTARLSDYVYVQVRSGVYDLDRLGELTLEAAASETSDPDRAAELAERVLARELQKWQEAASRWGARTDCDRLDDALEQLAGTGVLVLPGLPDDDSLAQALQTQDYGLGCVAYLVADIWRAIDTNSLILSVLDGAGHPAERSSALPHQLLNLLSEAGLLASFGSSAGQVEVALVWRRRPPG